MDVDYDFLRKHVEWMIESGSEGLVPLGSLGEGATLTHEEKREILRVCVEVCGGRIPVVPGVSGLSTDECISLAQDAKKIGCRGLMVLPPYVYRGDWRETRAHFRAVIESTDLACMLYNNPIAYGTDVTPWQMEELCDLPNLQAVKESSADVRRITGIKEVLGDRLRIFVGVDDIFVEGVAAGAVGWVAGLVNAFPRESVELYEMATGGADCRKLYEWFLPLLRLDTVPKFVQLIKLVQQEVGMGNERVRMPRMELVGEEREHCLTVVRTALANRP